MSHADLAKIIDDGFDQRVHFGPATKGPVREAVEAALDLLDRGAARVAERDASGHWRVNHSPTEAGLASVACWSRCRPDPSSSRTIASSGRAARLLKA